MEVFLSNVTKRAYQMQTLSDILTVTSDAPVFNIQPVRTLTELDKQEFEQIAKEVLAMV